MNQMDPLEYENKEYKTKHAYPSYVLYAGRYAPFFTPCL